MDKIHKMNLLLIIVFIVSIASTCSMENNGPNDIVNDYLNYMKSGDFRSAYGLVSSDDQKHKTYSEFEGTGELSNTIKKKFWPFIHWKIKKMEVSKSRAKITVQMSTPKIGEYIGTQVGAVLGELSKLENEKQALQVINQGVFERLNHPNKEFIEFEEEIDLVLENGTWKLFFNWGKEDEIRNAIVKAVALSNENNVDAAIDVLKNAIEKNGDNIVIRKYLDLLLESKHGCAEKDMGRSQLNN